MSAYAALRPRERTFVDTYVEGGNGAEAARAAGHKHKRADHIAWTYLTRPKVKAAVAERTEQALAKAGVRQVRVLKAIAGTAFFDPIDLFDEDGNLKQLRDVPMEARQSISSMEVEEVTTGTGDQRRVTSRIKKFKFESRTRSRELLANYLKLIVNTHTLANPDGTPLLPAAKETTDLDIARRIAFALYQAARQVPAATTPLSSGPISDSDAGKASNGQDSTSNQQQAT